MKRLILALAVIVYGALPVAAQVQGGSILIGGSDHTTRLEQGTCWAAGCHEAGHGSRVNSALRF